MARIDAASARQVSAVDDVERLLRRIGEGTRQSDNVARASSQAALAMREQAQDLAAAAETFVLGGHDAPPPARVA
jgi:methyl-accepting chemotaxis protein